MRRRSPRLDQTAGHSCDERLGPNVSRIGESGLTRPSARRPASRLRRRSRIVHATMEARTVSRSRSRTPDRQPDRRHVPPSCPLGHISRRAVGRRDTRSLEGDSRWYALPGVISQPLPRPKLLGVEDDPDALDPAFSDLERVHADGRPLVDRHRSRLTIDRSFHQIHRGWMPSEIDEAAGDLRSPSTGCSAAVTCPPPSATAVAEGSSRPMRASMSLASHACLKLRASLARSAVGTGDRLGSPNPQARRSGELSTGLRRATHDGSDVGGRVLKDVVEQEGNPLRGCHRLKDDQKCPVVHLATPRCPATVRAATRRRSALAGHALDGARPDRPVS